MSARIPRWYVSWSLFFLKSPPTRKFLLMSIACLLSILAYRLEYDNSWVPFKDIDRVDERKALIQKVMSRNLAIKDALQ